MRIGLAGTGRIGAFHAKTLTTLDGVDDLVLADLDSTVAERVAADLGVSAAPSIEALLDSGLDAFVITAGTAAHAELLEASISRDISSSLVPMPTPSRSARGVGVSSRGGFNA